MKDRIVHLKVKIKSLAVESKIIKKEKKKASDRALKDSLHYHNYWVVGPESRWSLIAYGFLRGLEYKQIENKTKKALDWNKITNLVNRFGVEWFYLSNESYDEIQKMKKEQEANFIKWREAAKLYIKEQQNGNGQ